MIDLTCFEFLIIGMLGGACICAAILVIFQLTRDFDE